MSCGTFIPKRIYELLKCIYNERMTVVCAPLGSGKSTTLREFVRRSRPDGCSCRFITGCATADECFCRVSRIMFGSEVHLPVTEEDGVELYRLNRSRKPHGELLLVVDCPAAAEMLLGNLYCLKLFLECTGVHLVVVSDELSHFQQRITDSLSVRVITEQELSLTADETRQYLGRCGIYDADYETISARSGGNIFRLRLCVLLLSQGQRIRSYDTIRMLHAVLVSRLGLQAYLALLCASAHYCINERMCAYLRADRTVAEYFGAAAINCERLMERLHEINDMIPVITTDSRSGRFEVHQLARRAAYRSFVLLPPNVRRSLHICTAKEFLARDRGFEAFCNFVVAKDYYSAAKITRVDSAMNVLPFLNAKEIMFRFVLECPLDFRPILPWLLHILALLMFTPYKERVKFRFDDIIRYLANSSEYTERERRDLLAYVHAMRMYQDFYAIEKMGMHIKRAYEYFRGESVYTPPFYLWALYVPSMFALVHRYSVSVSAQAEQYVRYNRMYNEISDHGRFFDRVYLAEMRYNVGDIADARSRALSIIADAVELSDASPRLIADTLAASCALVSGGYEDYTRHVNDIAAIMRAYPDSELYRMGALCLALIGCIGASRADVWRVTASTDSMIMSNRYAAPFCYYVRCISMLASGENTRLISRLDYYLQLLSEVNCETIALKIKMCAAAAYYNIEDSGSALRLMDEVLGALVGTGVVMPAVEICIHQPQLFVLAKEQLAEDRAAYIAEVMRISKSIRKNIDDLRTHQMTETWYEVSHNEQVLGHAESAEAAAREAHGELGLTERAMRYALLAARRYSNEDIARMCGTTADSVKSSLKRTFARLGVRSRAQLRYLPQLKKYLQDG